VKYAEFMLIPMPSRGTALAPPFQERRAEVSAVTMERYIRILAGSLVVLGVVLTWTVSVYWLLLPLFVGLNLFQSAFTGICPAENILRRLGVADSGGESSGHQAGNRA
jgi:Inner membrane protein YgaP-like, transmembrane domain